jgi:formyltetrahydrofolate-dependent phosphoribosylglycinamide formyltransferase
MTDSASKARVSILISGGGSNMVALVEASRAADCPWEVALVVSNNPGAPGLARAQALGVPTLAIDHRPFGKDRQAHERLIDDALRGARCDYVALAGYMRVLTPLLVEAWDGRMLNIHPALLPKYPGLNTHQRALDAGDPVAGCSTHLVTVGVDEGPILGQARVPVLPGDTAQTLAARVLVAEHRLYPATLSDLVRRHREMA